ncbi:pyruvate kinase [Adhaeribacter aerolatus]|uniref:pyruvate kinase n=1 Tax=Adhaeribacter aerolatus TaxID=670289 RepID=A0A512B1S0_9BACT|nr:pyruvate kinase [Adhaeribacter aerolatus]GEO05900.1 pyruvate kinase [Adhaeribacter aerolatus]
MQKNIEQLQEIVAQLDALENGARQLEEKLMPQVNQVQPAFKDSTINLLHYLALRHHDIRGLQEQLARLGLSSLGRSEGHVLANLQAVREQLCCALQQEAPADNKPKISFDDSAALLKKHTEDLLGPTVADRNSRIMVTFSTELATDYDLVRQMMAAGMNCARINCAHDYKSVWVKMVQNIRLAEQELGLSCKVLFDLMGPKLRTGPLRPGPKLVEVHPYRDELGQVIAPAKVWLAAPGVTPPFKVDAILPLAADWVNQLGEGDQLQFKDTRQRKRTLYVASREAGGVVAHLFKTSYISTGTRLKLKNRQVPNLTAEVEELPELEVPLLLKKDDLLVIRKELVPGEPAQLNEEGQVAQPAFISCTLPEVFTQVKVGQPILFDDGKIEAEIAEVNKNSLLVKITSAGNNGSTLRADKGINLPDSNLGLNKLTDKDRQDLAFVVKYADIINLSFANHPDMVEALQEELRKLRAGHVAIMLKIETKEGFRNLPHLLLTVMRSYPAGIMIARGDLAVECGWQRLAEVQEEILWLCEAAHLPVVWATQVLESLAKKGRPSRAEITDAAMAQRADCVMLNKGPYILEAIRMLDGILQRMQEHQYKKVSMLRSLQVSEIGHFYEENS